MKTKQWLGLGSFFALSIILSGCVADKNQQDYRKDQANKDLTDTMPIKGTYTGAMVSAKDGASIGNLTLTLNPDTVVAPSADGLTTEQKVIIRGSLVYSGVLTANISFNTGYYNPSNNEFQVNVDQVDAATVHHLINLKGNVINGQFIGNLMVDTYDNYGAQFTLNQNAAVRNSLPNLRSARAAEIVTTQKGFISQWKDPSTGEIRPLVLHFTDDTSSSLRFMGIFTPVHTLTVRMDVEDMDPTTGTYSVSTTFKFPNSSIDDDNNMNYITGLTEAAVGTPSSTLNCSRTIDNSGKISAINCNMTAANGGTISDLPPFLPAGKN